MNPALGPKPRADARFLSAGRNSLRVAVGFLAILPIFAGSTVGAQEPVVLRGPFLQSLLAESVEVRVLTDAPAQGKVRYQMAEGATEEALGEPSATDHRIRLQGLTPGARYSYEVLIDDRVIASGEDFRFRTAPPPGTGSFRAALIGDSGQTVVNGENLQRPVTEILFRLEPDLFLHSGDINYESREELDVVLFDEYAPLMRTVGIYPARGNHGALSVEDWFRVFSPPPTPSIVAACETPPEVCDEPAIAIDLPSPRPAVFYSFDWGPVHFAVVDSIADFEECSAQLRWLCADLAAAAERDVPWKIILIHHPAYSAGLHGPRPNFDGTDLTANQLIPPLAERYGVDVVISGHDHNYQRSFPLLDGEVVDAWQEPLYQSPAGPVYIVSGGGGATPYFEFPGAFHRPLMSFFYPGPHALEFEASPERLVFRSWAPEREAPLDEVTIDRSPRARPGFRRGDANFDDAINLTDAISILGTLFLGSGTECPTGFEFAGDTNSSAVVDIADATFLLNHLFLGGPPPDAPFDTCSVIPDFDAGGCHAASCRIKDG